VDMFFFFFQAEDGIRDYKVTGVQTCALPISKRICRSCPVRYECLADALDNRIEFGVWGGMTERERRALLRRHPQVPSWRKMFEEIGRASCRERVEIWVVAVAGKKKK